MSKSKSLYLIILASLVVLAILPFFGPSDWQKDLNISEEEKSFIFWQLRLPRTLLGLGAGAVLALAGLIFQNLFRNGLATPYTLGVSSGAAAGAVAALKLQLGFSFLGLGAMQAAGFLGALVSVGLILLIARSIRSYAVYTLPMAGIAINFFFSALIVLLQYLQDYAHTLSIMRWLMGGVEASGYREPGLMAVMAIVFLGLSLALRRELVLSAAGDSFAAGKGLEIQRFRLGLLVIVSLFVGITVSLIGPVGFIGLVIPHVCRSLAGSDYRAQILLSAWLGGVTLTLADFLSRTLIAPAEIPVGIITSFFGAPFFVYILVSTRGRNQS